MEKGKAFVVVGHSNWGKSKTLRSLTEEIYIKGYKIKIKRMSNNEIPFKEVIDFLNKLDSKKNPVIIITLCPNFVDKSKGTIKILDLLLTKFKLYFWVLKKRYNHTQEVEDGEIDRLRKYGCVEVVTKVDESNIRAKKFRRFIENNL
jgi:hypothetical protein